MYQSKLFYKTLKNAPKGVENISHNLLLRAGFISQLASGIYNFLPLGYKVHKKIEQIIREEMDTIGGQEVFLAALQPKELWQKTGRWENMDPPLFKIKDRHKKEFALGPTHEEVMTDFVKSRIQSYKDLPLALYQIQNKFRNEMRFTGGLLRTREFVMKDLYSFHDSQEDLERFFNKAVGVYEKIFKRCGLEIVKSEASGGVFTKDKTYEFQVLSDVGEDRIFFCSKCQWAVNLEVGGKKEGEKCPKCGKEKLAKRNSIEVGHCFKLGTRYSQALELYFRDRKGVQRPVEMGCYGIGLGRLMATVIESNHDEKGIIWPKEISPFDAHLIQLGNNKKIEKAAEKVYQELIKQDKEVLYDDREDVAPGEKFAEADLIGIPIRLVVSEKTLKNNCLEVKKRDEDKICLTEFSHIFQII